MNLFESARAGKKSLYDEACAKFGDDELVLQGTSLFNQAYAKAGGAGFGGTVAVAGGMLQGVSTGALATGLQQAAQMAEGAISGAAFGTAVFPGIGTAVGAVLGMVVSVVNDILSGPPPAQPEGEFRSTWEKYCFPARSTTDIQVIGSAGASQTGVLPATWPNIREQLAGYQVSNAPDPATGTNGPLNFTFTVGWIPAPGSTQQSSSQAFALAQGWIAQNPVTQALATAKGGTFKGEADSYIQHAISSLLSEDNYNQATELVNRWYGTSFPPAVFTRTANTMSDGKYWDTLPTDAASEIVWAKTFAQDADVINQTSGADGIYYVSEQFAMSLGQNVASDRDPVAVDQVISVIQRAAAWQVANMSVVGGDSLIQRVAMPDMKLVGLCEIACLVVTGAIPRDAADMAAYHWMLALCWFARRGQEEDVSSNETLNGSYLPIELPREFARVLAITSGLVKENLIQARKTGKYSQPLTKQTAHAKLISGAGRSASGKKLWKWLVGLSVVGGVIAYASRERE